MKEKYDPHCIFSSLWLQQYGLPYASERYRHLILREPKESQPLIALAPSTKANFIEVRKVSEQRTDSYRRLFKHSLLRRQFLEEFLVHVFNIEDPSSIFRMISKAVWDPDNKNDLDIYCFLQAAIAK